MFGPGNKSQGLLYLASASAAALTMAFLATPAGAAPQYTFKLLHAFCKFKQCTDGSGPNGSLLLDPAGEVFGATSGGGKYHKGLVFKLAPEGKRYTESILHNFCNASCSDGPNPAGDLVADKNGVLYGVAGFCDGPNRGGTIFSLTHGSKSWSLKVLHTFTNAEYVCHGLAYEGQESGAPWDGASPLFGVASSGGAYQNGYVFELKPSGWAFADIHDFQESSGPNLPVVDATGNVFGTNAYGGKYQGGLLYKLAAGTWKEATLRNFCSEGGACANGNHPVGQPVIDAGGNLYTATAEGGLQNDACIDSNNATCGVVFERTAGGAYKVLYEFCSLANCADGGNPLSGLTIDEAGNLFGATDLGGAARHCPDDWGCGVAFRLINNGNSSWSETVLHSFCNWDNCGDGSNPEASLAIDGAGDIFGTAAMAGEHGSGDNGGTVFELKL